MKFPIVRVTCGLGMLLLARMAGNLRGGVDVDETGWRGPYQDGCSYYWDGQQFTRYDCAQSPVYGWYGPYEDGCFYLWDGYQFIAADCSQCGLAVRTDGGEGMLERFSVSNFTPSTAGTAIGGQSLDIPCVPLSGIPGINAIDRAASSANTEIWPKQICVPVVGVTRSIEERLVESSTRFV